MKKKILIVDDNRVIRELLRIVLHIDFDLVEARNAEEALQMIDIHHPDAIVLDIMMPGPMNGFELCRQLKHDPRRRDMYIMLATGSWETIMENCGACHADSFVIKPFSPNEVKRILTEALQSTRTSIRTVQCEHTSL